MRIPILRPPATPVSRLRGAGLILAALAASTVSSANASPVLGQDVIEQEGESNAPKPLFLSAKQVIVRPGEVLENASVIVMDGKITAVGSDLTAPEGAERIEGEVICAAFMDPWSTAGIDSASVRTGDVNAASLAVDALDPYGQESILRELTAAGVLLTRTQLARTAEFSGVGAVIRTSTGEVVLSDAAISAAIGAERAGTRAFGAASFGPQLIDPLERIGQIDKLGSELEGGAKYAIDLAEYEQELAEWEIAIVEKEKELNDDFKKAKKARDKAVEKAKEDGKDVKEKKYKEDKRPRAPRMDAEKAVFADVVEGKIPLVVHAERALEIRDLLRITEAHPRLRLVIAGGTSALACKEKLAEREVTVIVAPSPAKPGGPVGELDPGLALAAELDAAGVNVLIGSGGRNALASRELPLLAALAVGHGLSRDAALRAITSGPARVFDVADQLGTIQRGQSADLLVLSGDPLASSSRILAAISAGVVAPTTNR